MKPCVFYFEFVIHRGGLDDVAAEDDDTIVKMYAFVINPAGMEKIGTVNTFTQEEWYENTFWELEGNYGVYDWSTMPSDEVEAIGYTSYEVDSELIEDLMNEWRNALAEKCGDHNITKVYKLPQSDYESDNAVYQATMAANTQKEI